MAKNKVKAIKVGDIYIDCSYHPVLCTLSEGDDIEGISLIDGSAPRCCSRSHCSPQKINISQALQMKNNWQEVCKNIDAFMESIGWGKNDDAKESK